MPASVVMQIKVYTNSFLFFYLFIYFDKATLQKYDHSNLFNSLHVGLIKPLTLHFQFSYDITNLMTW